MTLPSRPRPDRPSAAARRPASRPRASRRTVRAAALGAVAVLAAAVPGVGAAATPPAPTAPVADGVYTLGQRGQLVTQQVTDPDAHATLVPPAARPDAQRWDIRCDDGGDCTLRNVRSGAFLGHRGGPGAHQPVAARTAPMAWRLAPAGAPGTYRLLSAKDPNYALDISPLLIYPPRLDLNKANGNSSQVWEIRPAHS
ncbi:RICIN domain-containing protein [Streptomyces sp. NPDC059080]|uniref:RICIN domain-containing protein n=1 Tax=Streptomyces sp. NPDC059080 TaxID=3346718 RepID=UPI0036C73AFB